MSYYLKKNTKKLYHCRNEIIKYYYYYWIIPLICFEILTQNWITAKMLTDENGPLAEVQTAIGLEVCLPCDLIPSSATLIQDKVTLIIWYKEGSSKPIYSLDARGKPLQQAIHWADDDILKSKAHFHYDSNPPALRIKNSSEEDAGLYRCRVDFQRSPTRNWRINLTVLVPPTQLNILDNQGARMIDNVVGPYREGININVTCISSGGRPPPRVSWWKEHALLDDSFQVLVDGSVKNILYLSKLERKDLDSVYTCQASNGHVVPPLSSTVKLDMILPPLYVRIQGLNHPLISGARTQISCSSAGAKPLPQIVWNKGGVVMRGASQTTSSDGNVTISELVFLPIPEDNGKLVTCSVTTDTIIGGAGVFLKDSRLLDVKHAPIVSLTLGAPLDPFNLMKGSDVYLECDVKANPPSKKVEWFYNDKQLQSLRGIIVANQTLVLQGITKATHGQYMCRSTNAQGTVGSNEVYLDVKYPPVCISESTIIRAAVKQTVNVSCHVDSNPMVNLTYKWSFNNSLENTIELPTIETLLLQQQQQQQQQLEDRGTGTDIIEPYAETVYSNTVHQQTHQHHQHKSSRSKHYSKYLEQQQQQQLQHEHSLHQYDSIGMSQDNNVYPYKVETFQHFGTITCYAQNTIGKSGPCLYHIMAAEVPEPIKNCTSYNATANSIQLSCIPGKDGGIQQYFFVEIYDETNRSILYNTSFKYPDFTVKRLPSDTNFRIKISAYNLQGSASPFKMKIKTLPAPLLRTASSTAVLVQLTPLLGALVGAIATLLLVAFCILVFVKFRTNRNMVNNNDNITTNEPDKGSAEPLSRNMDEKNPDVIPQENSEDEFVLEEKAFDRLNIDQTHRILYATNINRASPLIIPTQHQSIHHSNPLQQSASIPGTPSLTQHHQLQHQQFQHDQSTHHLLPSPTHFITTNNIGSSNIINKPYGELSLTTNPAFALYNSPHRRAPPLYSSPPPPPPPPTLTSSSLLTNSNIYTRIPTRSFTPYETRTSPTSSIYGIGGGGGGGGGSAITMPLLLQNNGHHSPLSSIEGKS